MLLKRTLLEILAAEHCNDKLLDQVRQDGQKDKKDREDKETGEMEIRANRIIFLTLFGKWDIFDFDIISGD